MERDLLLLIKSHLFLQGASRKDSGVGLGSADYLNESIETPNNQGILINSSINYCSIFNEVNTTALFVQTYTLKFNFREKLLILNVFYKKLESYFFQNALIRISRLNLKSLFIKLHTLQI